MTPTWQTRAACRGLTHLFYAEDARSLQRAKQICRTCPVAPECLQAAIDNTERYGVWAGTGRDERRRIKAQGQAAA
jgi:WhiB family redox-sensing transcriptional regulator